MSEEPIKVGNKYTREIGKCPHLIILISMDRQPGWEYEGDIWRCVQFQINRSDDSLFGGQIVLYADSEIKTFTHIGILEPNGVTL